MVHISISTIILAVIAFGVGPALAAPIPQDFNGLEALKPGGGHHLPVDTVAHFPKRTLPRDLVVERAVDDHKKDKAHHKTALNRRDDEMVARDFIFERDEATRHPPRGLLEHKAQHFDNQAQHNPDNMNKVMLHDAKGLGQKAKTALDRRQVLDDVFARATGDIKDHGMGRRGLLHDVEDKGRDVKHKAHKLGKKAKTALDRRQFLDDGFWQW